MKADDHSEFVEKARIWMWYVCYWAIHWTKQLGGDNLQLLKLQHSGQIIITRQLSEDYGLRDIETQWFEQC